MALNHFLVAQVAPFAKETEQSESIFLLVLVASSPSLPLPSLNLCLWSSPHRDGPRLSVAVGLDVCVPSDSSFSFPHDV